MNSNSYDVYLKLFDMASFLYLRKVILKDLKAYISLV